MVKRNVRKKTTRKKKQKQAKKKGIKRYGSKKYNYLVTAHLKEPSKVGFDTTNSPAGTQVGGVWAINKTEAKDLAETFRRNGYKVKIQEHSLPRSRKRRQQTKQQRQARKRQKEWNKRKRS